MNEQYASSHNIAVYAGSFDPPTCGHIWMIREGAKLFDSLIVSIGVNPDKTCTFDVEQRLEWLNIIVKDIASDVSAHGDIRPTISVDRYDNQFLVQYAASIGANAIIRGIRNETDYTYERTMRHINADLQTDITTVFLIPPRHLAEISSSTVKTMIGPLGWNKVVKNFVPDCVFSALEQWHDAQ